MANYVYFIWNTRTNNYKIGRSIDVAQRLKQLQTANDSKLVIYRQIKTSNLNLNLELILHSYFNDYKLVGEWFNITKDDIDKDPILVKMYAKIGRLTMDDTLVRGRAGKPPEKKSQFEPEFEQKYGNKG